MWKKLLFCNEMSIMVASNTNTEIALLKQEIKYTNEAVARIEKNTALQHVELKIMMQDFIDSAWIKFVSREEHQENRRAIEEIQDSHKWIIRSAFWAIWSFTIWIILFILKKIWVL